MYYDMAHITVKVFSASEVINCVYHFLMTQITKKLLNMLCFYILLRT